MGLIKRRLQGNLCGCRHCLRAQSNETSNFVWIKSNACVAVARYGYCGVVIFFTGVAGLVSTTFFGEAHEKRNVKAAR